MIMPPSTAVLGATVAVDILLWRMLLDAVRALDGPNRSSAAAWVANIDRTWPLSFDNVCEALGIQPAILRLVLDGAGSR